MTRIGFETAYKRDDKHPAIYQYVKVPANKLTVRQRNRLKLYSDDSIILKIIAVGKKRRVLAE